MASDGTSQDDLAEALFAKLDEILAAQRELGGRFGELARGQQHLAAVVGGLQQQVSMLSAQQEPTTSGAGRLRFTASSTLGQRCTPASMKGGRPTFEDQHRCTPASMKGGRPTFEDQHHLAAVQSAASSPRTTATTIGRMSGTLPPCVKVPQTSHLLAATEMLPAVSQRPAKVEAPEMAAGVAAGEDGPNLPMRMPCMDNLALIDRGVRSCESSPDDEEDPLAGELSFSKQVSPSKDADAAGRGESFPEPDCEVREALTSEDMAAPSEKERPESDGHARASQAGEALPLIHAPMTLPSSARRRSRLPHRAKFATAPLTERVDRSVTPYLNKEVLALLAEDEETSSQ